MTASDQPSSRDKTLAIRGPSTHGLNLPQRGEVEPLKAVRAGGISPVNWC